MAGQSLESGERIPLLMWEQTVKYLVFLFEICYNSIKKF